MHLPRVTPAPSFAAVLVVVVAVVAVHLAAVPAGAVMNKPVCSTCKGAKYIIDKCPSCGGDGQKTVHNPFNGQSVTTKCTRCDGTGKGDKKVCPSCYCHTCVGKGRISFPIPCSTCLGRGRDLETNTMCKKCLGKKLVDQWQTCPTCKGTGYGDGTPHKPCPICNKSGMLYELCRRCGGEGSYESTDPEFRRKYMQTHAKCPTCNGTGRKKTTHKCPACKGALIVHLNDYDKLKTKMLCPMCGGVGTLAALRGTIRVPCHICVGQRLVDRATYQGRHPCPTCYGFGKIYPSTRANKLVPCPDCKGKMFD